MRLCSATITLQKQSNKGSFSASSRVLPSPGSGDLWTLPHQAHPTPSQGQDTAFSYRHFCPSVPSSQGTNLIQTWAHLHQTRRLKLQTCRQLPAGWKTKGFHCFISESSRNPNHSPAPRCQEGTLAYAGSGASARWQRRNVSRGLDVPRRQSAVCNNHPQVALRRGKYHAVLSKPVRLQYRRTTGGI